MMQYSLLGSSGETVSRVCLGSMTWGLQNSQLEANEQIEYALSQGVNFIDTAELYPVPPSGEKYASTEIIIGVTSMAQLKENLAAFSAPLNKKTLSDIRQVFRDYPVPF